VVRAAAFFTLPKVPASECGAFRPLGMLGRSLPGINDYTELLQLDPSEFTSLLLEGSDLRCKLKRAFERKGETAPRESDDAPQNVRWKLLRSEEVSADRVRIHYERSVLGGDEPVGVVSSEELTREANGEWRIVARSDLLTGGEAAISFVSPDLADLLDE
jgi:hypothetical protein